MRTRTPLESEHVQATSSADWAQFTQWLHYPEGCAFVPLFVTMLLLRSEQGRAVIDGCSQKENRLYFDYIAQQLGDSLYILGKDSIAADFGVSYVVSLGERLGQLTPWHTFLSAYLARTQARLAYLRALERAVE